MEQTAVNMHTVAIAIAVYYMHMEQRRDKTAQSCKMPRVGKKGY